MTGGPGAPGSDPGTADDRPARRRRGPRRATGGRAPDPELAVDDPVLRSLPGREVREDAGEAAAAGSERARERWLRRQRPPHWG